MRFSLQTLLLCFVVIWSAMAAFGVGGIVVAGVSLAVAACVRSAETITEAMRLTASVVLVFLVPCCMLMCLLTPRSGAREAARRAQCSNNLKQIAFSLHSYHDRYGCFPPAYIADEEGKPMHSWRVLILPFIEEQALYDRYAFTEPWDGPSNRRLAGPVQYAVGVSLSERSIG